MPTGTRKKMTEPEIKAALFRKVIKFETTKGHLKWKISELARAAGISRTLVYYHLGASKVRIVSTCLEIIASEVFGLSPESMKDIEGGRMVESLIKTQHLFANNPEIAIFYYKWRSLKSENPTPLQQQFLEIEKRYLSKLTLLFPNRRPAEILGIYGLMHGLVTGPFVTEAALRCAFPVVLEFASRAKPESSI